jgi:hypothetical protein
MHVFIFSNEFAGNCKTDELASFIKREELSQIDFGD